MNPANNSEGEAEAKRIIANKYYTPTDSDLEDLESWKREIGINYPDNDSDEVFKVPSYNMMNNYLRLASWNVVHDYPLQDMKHYFVVFKPFNKKYNSNYDGMDHVRKALGDCKAMIITREIRSAKVHYNALIATTQNFIEKHEKNTSRYMMYVKSLDHKNFLDTVHACNSVHEYIIKESKLRYFIAQHKKGYKVPLDIYVRMNNIRWYNDLS